MGQCFGINSTSCCLSFRKLFNRKRGQHEVLVNNNDEIPRNFKNNNASERSSASVVDPQKEKKARLKKNHSLMRIFALTRSRRKYKRHENDEVELPEIEKAIQAEEKGNNNNNRHSPPDVSKVAGLRNDPTTCSYPKRGMFEPCLSSGRRGSKFMILNPRDLDGRYSACSGSDLEYHSKSLGHQRQSTQSSIDLEWEPEESMIPFVEQGHLKDSSRSSTHFFSSDNASSNGNIQSSCSTVAPETRNSEFSSQNSIPGLDWDSQTDNELMTRGLESLARELETEQLITEIEQLTNRALEETNQWSTSLPPSPRNNSLNIYNNRLVTSDISEVKNRSPSNKSTGRNAFEERNGNDNEWLSNPTN